MAFQKTFKDSPIRAYVFIIKLARMLLARALELIKSVSNYKDGEIGVKGCGLIGVKML